MQQIFKSLARLVNSCVLFSGYVELVGKLVSAKEERVNKKDKTDASIFFLVKKY